MLQPADPGSGISYPNLDEPPPPAYDSTVTEQPGGVGQLIDLGTDITAPPTQQPPPQQQGDKADDIVAQLAQLGITSSTATTAPVPATTTAVPDVPPQPPQVQGQPGTDEFDIFAKSRTAYGTTTAG